MLYMNQGLTSIVIKWKSNSYNIKAFRIKELQAKMGYCNKSARNWTEVLERGFSAVQISYALAKL